MPALVIQLNQICISYAYDGLTVYQTDKPINKKQLKKSVFSQSEALGFERLIDRSDAEHNFYHSDGLDRNIPHAHIKFKKMPTREQLSALLQEFVKYKVLTEEEINQFLTALERRYNAARSLLAAELKQSEAEKETIIMNHINRCDDNDILADLHCYLLGREFDDLRVNHSCLRQWIGTDSAGLVVPTSKLWARIEKCIALKMAMNFCEQTEFNADIGKHAASQLTGTHSFFAIKRKAGRDKVQNNAVTDFANGKCDALAERYRKNFSV